jgi:hypothetical protein
MAAKATTRFRAARGQTGWTAATAFDIASYETATTAIRIDLLNPALATGEAAGDQFLSIEGFRLSGFADSFAGTDLATAPGVGRATTRCPGAAGPTGCRAGRGTTRFMAGMATTR